MLFFSSLLFSLLCFALPGEFAILAAARILSGVVPLPVRALEALLNVIVFLVLRFVVGRLPGLYVELQLESDACARLARDFLHVRGLRWLNIVALVLVTTGGMILLLHGMLPYPYIFLYVAIVIGFADILPGRPISLLGSATTTPPAESESKTPPATQEKT